MTVQSYLQVLCIITREKSPPPALVIALTLNSYLALAFNSVIVWVKLAVRGSGIYIESPSPTTLYCTRYPLIIPLGVSGGNHDKVTVVSVTSTTVSDLGAVGSEKI